jgi:transcriptional regulator with XRE-family HTH domain
MRSINKHNRVPREALIAARERVGFTRPQLADRLKFSRSYVFRVEVGEIDPDVGRMAAWLRTLGDGASPALFERHRSIAKWAGFEPSEDQVTAAVLEHWRTLGVPGSLVASIPNRKAFGQAGLTRGLPDLIVLSPQLGNLTGFIEQKRGRRRPPPVNRLGRPTRKGRLSAAQIDIGNLLVERGVPYAVCYGRDEPIKILEEWGAVRSARAA